MFTRYCLCGMLVIITWHDLSQLLAVRCRHHIVRNECITLLWDSSVGICVFRNIARLTRAMSNWRASYSNICIFHWEKLFIESSLCEDDLLEWEIHFFGPVFRFVCNAKLTCLVQNLFSVYDAKSTCSAHCLALVDEFCRSLTVSNEQIRSVKILRYDKLPIFTCDAGVSPVLAVRDPGLFHWRFYVFLLGPSRSVFECHNYSRLPPPKAAFVKQFTEICSYILLLSLWQTNKTLCRHILATTIKQNIWIV